MVMLPSIKKLIDIEPDKCTSCRICEILCSLVKTGMCNPALSRIKVVSDVTEGVDVAVVCFHCEKPPCRDICPVNAIKVDPASGIVKVDEEECIGCRLCMLACPYGAISYNIQTRKVMKCDLCNGDPICVKYCQTQAITFARGDMISARRKRAFAEEVKPVVLERRKVGEKGGM